MSQKTESAHSMGTAVFRALTEGYEGPNFAIRLWDGQDWRFGDLYPPAYTIVFKNPTALRALLVDPSEITLGEAFIHGDLDVEGDLFSVFDLAQYILNRPAEIHRGFLQSCARTSSWLRHWLREAGRHSLPRDRAAIAYHYDQPVDFYRLWLGKTLVYSCAYFETGTESLDEAQEAKLELICRKLRLKPLERFLDIGCGWGSMILHAAGRHSAHAHGVTLSREQAKTVVERIKQSDMTQSCVVELKDYREMAFQLPFDKIASIGMFEHVGAANLSKYFAIVHELLKPGGAFLNHGICRSQLVSRRSASFVDRYVFPDGELVPINQALAAAEGAGLEVRDVENLREHYERTLRLWVTALEANEKAALEKVSQVTYRIWRLYMAGSAAAFRRADIALYQTLLSRPMMGKTFMPLTRRDWYCPES